MEVVNWIYACFSTASFTVLISGSPSDYFHGNRVLWKGCPLSPYLFILSMEGLILMINKAFLWGSITGIRVAHALHNMHLLFVDDVVLFGARSKDEWFHYRRILIVFCDASGWRINANKYSFACQCADDNIRSYISGSFPYVENGLEEGILSISASPSSLVLMWSRIGTGWFRKFLGG